MPLEAALFTQAFDDRDLTAACEHAADIGYGAVEIRTSEPHLPADTPIAEVRALRDRLEELGLAVACLYTDTGGYDDRTDAERRAELDALEPFLEFADILDCEVVKHGVGGPPEFRADDTDYARAAEWLGRAADRAAEHEVTVGVEIHGGSLAESARGARELIDRTGHDAIGVIHDAGNMYLAGEPFGADTIETLGECLVHLHLKDLERVADPSMPGAFRTETKRGDESFQHRLLGDGAVDHRELFDALASREFDGYATAECLVPQPNPGDDIDIARHEYRALVELLATAGG